VYADEDRTGVLATFHTLRQQSDKGANEPDYALGDFVAPRETGLRDYLGVFAVTTGINIEPLVAGFEKTHDDYSATMVKALADRLAEALAEMLHKRAREDWGYGRSEPFSYEELIREQYRGIRPAHGYPACPDHTEKATLWRILQADRTVGIQLTESFAMYPASSVSGLYFSHPQSRYFALGKIGRDQVVDYQRRKQMDLAEVERWLAPHLNYDPDEADEDAANDSGRRSA
jgi:5-methyltetrahydrofolate--homocysteine methyltransferase